MKLLAFHATFGISWITSWTYKKDLSAPDSNIFWITRNIKIKWWNKFNPELIKESVLSSWFSKNPNFVISHPDADKESGFLAEKTKFLAELTSSSNKKDFLKKLQAALSESDANNDEDSVSSSHSLTPINEDDCFGIIDL